MNKNFTVLYLIVILVAVSLACATQAPAPTATPPPNTAVPATDTPMPLPTETPTPNPTQTPTITPTPTPNLSIPSGKMVFSNFWGEIYVLDLTSSEEINISFSHHKDSSAYDAPVDWYPKVSPDHTKVAFEHVVGWTPMCCSNEVTYELYIMNLDGSNVIATGVDAWGVTWALDSSYLVLGVDEQIYTILADGTSLELHPINNFPGEIQRIFSFNDGIYFLANCNPNVCLLDETGQEAYHLTKAQYTPFNEEYFSGIPSPDGRQFVFQTLKSDQDPENCGVSETGCLYEIYLFDVQSGLLNSLTTGFNPVWSPDGTQIAYLDSDELVYVISADGSGKTQITKSILGQTLSWLPDSKWLAIYYAGKLDSGIRVVRLETGIVTNISTQSPGFGELFWWQP